MIDSIFRKMLALLVIGLIASGVMGQTTFQIEKTGSTGSSSKSCGGDIHTYHIPLLNLTQITRPADEEPGTNGTFAFSWGFTHGNCLGFSCATQSSVSVLWNTTCNTGMVTCGVLYHYTDTNGSAKTSGIPTLPHTVNIKLLPSGVNVSGPANVECRNSSQLTYSTSDCAMDYVWSLPTGWTLNSPPNRSSITVTPHPLNGGKVKVTASNTCQNSANNGTLKDSMTVQRTCPDHASFTTATSSLPTHTPVNKTINCDPTSGWITVPAGSAVFFRAGEVITIGPNFEASHGSTFQAKMGPCTDCEAFKHLAEPGSVREEDSEDEGEDLPEFTICPNPSDGNFTIACTADPGAFSSPVQVRVFDLQGRQVLERSFQGGAEMAIDISGNPAGMYIVRLVYAGELYVQRVQKF